MNFLLVLLLADLSSATAKPPQRTTEGPLPKVVFYTTTPGPDIDFVWYVDGRVLYHGDSGYQMPHWFEVRLDEAEQRRLAEDLALDDVAKVESDVVGPRLHCPDNVVEFWSPKKHVVRVIRRLWDPQEKQGAPPAFLRLYDRLAHYSHPRARPYTPEYVEIIFWAKGTTGPTSVKWPVWWPKPLTDRQQPSDVATVRLPAREIEEYQRLFEETRHGEVPVLIDGRQYWLRGPRPSVPNARLF